ncbi:S8 family serine peptidase [Proteinivorax tanatarense]|uniref:S8 family serine peptidase n=1 Tax=Proteinivorax tanatarense TaxID=1260629 RepID=A0AAU7VNL7_9FIRM
MLILVSSGFSMARPVEFERVIVGFEKGIDKNVIQNTEGKVVKEFDFINAVVMELPAHTVQTMESHPNVKYVEPDAEVKALNQTVPWGIDRVNAPDVHSDNQYGDGIRVSVLDTGILLNHEDLNVMGGYSVFGGSYNDDNGHGTHVAGTIAALDNHYGVIGVSPQVDLYGVKVLDSRGSGSYSGIIEGIYWSMNNNMDIINMSLGGSVGSVALEDACNAATDAGLLVVAAAGNSGNFFGWGDNIGYPAKYPSVMAVGSTTSSDSRSSFSSTGPDLEIMAPGSNILSTTYNGGYGSMSGTSMACPHAAGVAALVWSANENLTNQQVRDIINDSANDMWNNPSRYGNGLIDAHEAYLYAISY